MREERLLSRVDWFTILIYFALVLIGWINIYAADFDPDTSGSIFNISQNSGKQLLWIATSVVLIGIVFLIDAKAYETFSWIIYGAMITLLLAVLIFGTEVAGSRSWFQLGGFRLQPSEFSKFATVVALSAFLSKSSDLRDLKTLALAVAIFSVPALLIVLQGDAGTAMVYGSLVIVLFRQGMNPLLVVAPLIFIGLFLLTLLVNQTVLIISIVILAILAIGLSKRTFTQIAIIVAILFVFLGTIFSVDFVLEDVLKPHQQRRVQLLVNPNIDPLGVGWNVTQSKIAIGSGGFSGKGYLRGTQTKFDFVPAQSTDFIFCTVGEEHGWLGTTLVLILFAVLLMRMLAIADRQKAGFPRLYGYGAVSIIFFHILVNVSMTVGLFPVIGIPLPFISYGGSSLWSFTILLFILLKLDAQRMQILQR